jgi:Domain of unknown function (DUF4175)
MLIEALERAETEADPRRVVDALESTRRSLKRFGLAMGLAGLILALIAGCVVIAVADVSWVLPTWVRAVALAGLTVAALGYLVSFLGRSRRLVGPIETASEIETAYPELGQRVRTTLEYLEPTPKTMPASPSLVGALVADTNRRSRSLPFSVVVPWSRLNRRLLGLAGALVLVVVGMAYDSNLAIAARRLFLVPVHYTNLAVEPGDQSLKAGSDFTLKATLSGRPVRSARWLRRPVGSRDAWTSTPLGDFSRPILGAVESSQKDCQADFEYRVVAGELESDVYRVHVTHPLALKSFAAAIEPPSYTRLKPSVAKEGDFKAPEGSKIRFAITLDREPVSARISWTAQGSKTPQILPLTIVGNQLSGELPPLDKDIAYEISADASDRMTLDPLRYKIKVQPDTKPTLKFLKPAETHAATATTEVPIKLQASDDYGVARVGISYRVGDGPEETLYLDNPRDQPPSVDVLTTLYLEKHKLSIADSLSYQAFVEDNRVPSPQRVTSELRFIDILPYKQDYQLVDGGLPSNGSSVTLEELILRQRVALNRTLAHAEDKPVDDKVADRLSKDEAELAFATEEFAAKLASQFGPINPLDDAAKAMQAATVTLASKDFPASMPLEQSAMASLVKARQNLRKLMTTASTAGQCQKIDRQQRDQKIRKPPAEKSKEAELAKLEQDIRKLAENQKKFAEDVAPRSGGGARLDRQNEPKPGQTSKSAGSKPSSSPTESQRAASKEAERLNSLAKEDKALSDLARARMAEAARSIKESEKSLETDKVPESADAARSAAEQLERLAEQVAGLKAEDLASRIGKARDLARSTARAERELASKGPADDKAEASREQQGLAEDAKTLSDLLKKARADATEEDRTLARALEAATETHSLAEIEQAIRRASSEIETGQAEKSARSMKQAEAQLDGLAHDLETARRDFMQPKLQQLLAAEKQADEARKALESVSSEARKAEAEKAVADLARTVGSLRSGDGPLRQAAESLSQATQPSGTNAWNPPKKTGPRPGFYTPPISYTKAVGEVAKALQARIQELILTDALVDRDGPVPPGYKEKVEDYFRVLSEDLR